LKYFKYILNLILLIFLPFVLCALSGDLFFWSFEFAKFWCIACFIFIPLGYLAINLVLPKLQFETLIWISVPMGLVIFTIVISFLAPLGFSLKWFYIILIYFLILSIFFIINYKLKKLNLFHSDTEIKVHENKNLIWLYPVAFSLFWLFIQNWFNSYKIVPADVDPQAITSMIHYMEKYHSYINIPFLRFPLPAETFLYPPGFLSIATFLMQLTQLEPVSVTLVLTQFLLALMPLIVIATANSIFHKLPLIIIALFFTIGSGFYSHMSDGGSTDAMGLFCNLIFLFLISLVDIKNIKISFPQICYAGMALGLAMLSNSIYFFYVAAGMIFAIPVFILRNIFFKNFRGILHYLLIAGMILIVSFFFITPWAVKFNNPLKSEVAKYETTIENTKISNGYKLLRERLSADGFRTYQNEIYIALIGFFFLIFYGKLPAIIVAGSLLFIFCHLQADWITNYIWLPKFLYGLSKEGDKYFVTMPFVFYWHYPQAFSWVALDSFLAIAASSIAAPVFIIWEKVSFQRPFWKNFVRIFLVLIIATGFYRYWPTLLSSPLIQRNIRFQPFEIPLELINFIKHKTDPDKTLILIPKYLFFDIPGQKNEYQWGWVSPLTRRETVEDRLLLFTQFRGVNCFKEPQGCGNYAKMIQYCKELYGKPYVHTPEGEFAKVGLTHAILPKRYAYILQKRKDVRLLFEYWKDRNDGGFFVQFTE
jgi:hypothetical protein